MNTASELFEKRKELAILKDSRVVGLITLLKRGLMLGNERKVYLMVGETLLVYHKGDTDYSHIRGNFNIIDKIREAVELECDLNSSEMKVIKDKKRRRHFEDKLREKLRYVEKNILSQIREREEALVDLKVFLNG